VVDPLNAGLCAVDTRDGAATLRLAGEWRLAELARVDEALSRLSAPGDGVRVWRVDGAGLTAIDTAGAMLLLRHLTERGVDVAQAAFEGFEPSHRRIVEVVRERLGAAAPPPRRPAGPLEALGAFATELGQLVSKHLGFLGLTLSALGRALLRPHTLRLRELFAQLLQVGVTAIPVVSLVMVLIGLVVAYLLGQQAEKYGANIFVVDGVGLGMVREFSPLLVATIVAGRSGAAFTAQLGTMKLTEEIDAIRTLGLSVEQVLLVPRVLALCIALPLLVFVGSVAGLAGAAMVCSAMLDITPSTFVDRLHESLAARHYVIGLAKAPVFALFIAVIGCAMGMTVRRDTRAIGISTTSTVVQSIVVVILLDAFFAVLFQELDL
jgi:phospholipid/cholesterol/gamma-HCH transport system permease protein